MKQSKLLLLAILLFSVNALSRESGVVDRNITFTTYKGETHDLHDLLNAGKHIYILTFKYPG